jgi:Ni/Co efflux regulator RcnB
MRLRVSHPVIPVFRYSNRRAILHYAQGLVASPYPLCKLTARKEWKTILTGDRGIHPHGNYLRSHSMKAILAASLFFALASVGMDRIANADEHDNHHYVRHDDWKKGAKIHDEDWQRGEHVDYHDAHLRAPPRGYEWRMVDGNYVLAAVATGVIASVVAADIAAH